MTLVLQLRFKTRILLSIRILSREQFSLKNVARNLENEPTEENIAQVYYLERRCTSVHPASIGKRRYK